MTLLRTLALVLLVGAIAAPFSPAAAQSKAPAATPPASAAAQDDDQTKDISTLTVFLPIVVLDKQEKFVPGLTQRNFRVFEDGVEQKIEDFESPSQLPLYIAILLDTSSSVKMKLKFEKEAAADFVLSIMRGSTDQALFATFDSAVTLHSDFTHDSGDLTRAIDAVKAGGDTRLYDAVYRVCEEKMSLVPAGVRPVIVVVTDGEDTASDRTLADAIQIAQRANATVYGISTRNYSGITAGLTKGTVDKALDKLCSETGGRTFLPYQRIELARAFNDVRLMLRNQYVVYYTPTNQREDGKFREIKVDVNGVDQKIQVRAKRGYYASRPNADQVPR